MGINKCEILYQIWKGCKNTKSRRGEREKDCKCAHKTRIHDETEGVNMNPLS